MRIALQTLVRKVGKMIQAKITHINQIKAHKLSGKINSPYVYKCDLNILNYRVILQIIT